MLQLLVSVALENALLVCYYRGVFFLSLSFFESSLVLVDSYTIGEAVIMFKHN